MISEEEEDEVDFSLLHWVSHVTAGRRHFPPPKLEFPIQTWRLRDDLPFYKHACHSSNMITIAPSRWHTYSRYISDAISGLWPQYSDELRAEHAAWIFLLLPTV